MFPHEKLTLKTKWEKKKNESAHDECRIFAISGHLKSTLLNFKGNFKLFQIISDYKIVQRFGLNDLEFENFCDKIRTVIKIYNTAAYAW